MRYGEFFDVVIESGIAPGKAPVDSILELIFRKIPSRDENPIIVLSHDGEKYVRISLSRLRFITWSLMKKMEKLGLRPGDSVTLSHLTGTNELFVLLVFSALAASGVRTLLPMFVEPKDLGEWLRISGSKLFLSSGKELLDLDGHEKEKEILEKLPGLLDPLDIRHLDFIEDFSLRSLIHGSHREREYLDDDLVSRCRGSIKSGTELLMITTSGTSGKSKLVTYNHGAMINNCMAWRKAGFLDREVLGGRGFTPHFAHTMGVRAYMNALWCGSPLCLVKTDWFSEKPETARYLLLKMKPEHITGGPSVFSSFLELARVFPELKNELFSGFKTLVSSGAPYDMEVAEKIESATGLKLHNAFGMTETQQVLSTVFSGEKEHPGSHMGQPLPGVTVGLKRFLNFKKLYKLYFKSPFGYSDISGLREEEPHDRIPKGFFYSEDIVRYEGGELRFEGRENKDFLNNGYGVKVPLSYLDEYYRKLKDHFLHMEYFPVKGEYGLAALLFLREPDLHDPSDIITRTRVLDRFRNIIREINNELYTKLEPFEFNHRFISRFTIINRVAPKSVKGNVSRSRIDEDFNNAIRELTDPFSSSRGIVKMGLPEFHLDKYTRYNNPRLGLLLETLGIDYTYHRAEKDSLYTRIDGEEVEILDFVGGFGANLLGHNNSELKRVVTGFLERDEVPLLDQGSIQKHTGDFAEKLTMTVGKITGKAYYAVFGSTGAEAVEMALHHALLEWNARIDRMEERQLQRFGDYPSAGVVETWKRNREIIERYPVNVIALEGGFHGHTSGARSVLGSVGKRLPFRRMNSVEPLFETDSGDYRTRIGDLVKEHVIPIKRIVERDGALVAEEFGLRCVIAAIAEPLLGEGGVREVDRDFLHYLAGFDFPLIIDEIQTGLGRTGRFLASEGITSDYYLFSKSLGGGIEKVSALLIDTNRYRSSFGEYYTSTFGGGGLGSKVGSKVLEIVERDDIPEAAREKGKKLFRKLDAIREEYPEVLKAVNGRGLFIGLHLRGFRESEILLLRIIDSRKLLGKLYAVYLLKKHGIRTAPTLSAPNVLRIQPSAYITDENIDRLAAAVRDLAGTVSSKSMHRLFSVLMDGDPFEDNRGKIPECGFFYSKLDKAKKGSVKIAFISHFVYPLEELRMMEPALCGASDTGLRILFNKLQFLLEMKPFIGYAKNIFNGKVNFIHIALPIDSSELERMHRTGRRRKVVSRIQDAVDMAAGMGVSAVSLGGFISILSNDGLALAEPGSTRIVTGNTLTAVAGFKRFIGEILHNEKFLKRNTLGIVGATGNIGSRITMELFKLHELFGKIVLIGRKRGKLERLKSHLLSMARNGNLPRVDVEIATDVIVLKECDIISIATSSNDPIVYPHHLSEQREYLISDLSVPFAVSKAVLKMPNVTFLPFISYVSLPFDKDFVISSQTPPGSVFCCAAEAILYGLEPVDEQLRGRITSKGIAAMTRLGEKYGVFGRMGTVKTFKATKG